MVEKSKISSFSQNLLRNIQSMDGKVIGKDMQPFKLRLAKDHKGAMINNIVDKYLKKELDDEYLQQVKEEYSITSIDIAREIAKREIEKALGT